MSPPVESGGVSGPSESPMIITVPLPLGVGVVVWGWPGHNASKKAMIISIIVLFFKMFNECCRRSWRSDLSRVRSASYIVWEGVGVWIAEASKRFPNRL